MEKWAKWVLEFEASDVASVINWLHGQLLFLSGYGEPWPRLKNLKGVRVVPASGAYPFPRVQVRCLDPDCNYDSLDLDDDIGNPYPEFERAKPAGVIRTALWVELRPLGNGRMHLLAGDGGEGDFDGVPRLLETLAAAIQKTYERVSVDDKPYPQAASRTREARIEVPKVNGERWNKWRIVWSKVRPLEAKKSIPQLHLWLSGVISKDDWIPPKGTLRKIVLAGRAHLLEPVRPKT